MIQTHLFTWNPLRENSYVIFDETQDCIIIDPGCYERFEQDELTKFISSQKLNPVLLLNTHCHIDHVFGNKFVFDSYGLLPHIHTLELEILQAISSYAPSMGLKYEVSPLPKHYIEPYSRITFGNSYLQALPTPGHSPGSLSFYSKADKLLFSGDALFYESIGRTDLPGGDTAILLASVKKELFALDPNTRVLSGHGWETSIAHEIEFNPYIRP